MFLDLPHLAARYPTQVFEERRAELFQAQHREHAYYTAALALYRLELALSNQYVPRQYQSYKWHMLMLLKYLLAGSDAPGLAHRKFDDYCEKMVREIASGGKQSAPPYMEAVEIIKKVGEVSRDRLKGSRYAEELQTAARLAFKAKTSSSKSEQSRK